MKSITLKLTKNEYELLDINNLIAPSLINTKRFLNELVIPMDFIDNLREFLNCGLNKFPQSNELKSILSKLDKEVK